MTHGGGLQLSTTMQEILKRLRAAREARGLSLDDISAVTRIRRQVLQDLEAGKTAGIPATYVRAFIRSYASEVGLDAEEILREYDSRTQELAEEGRARRESRTAPQRTAPSPGSPSRVSAPLLITGVLILAFIVSLSFLYEADKEKEVSEIPFSEVVKQQESRSSQRRDSLASPEVAGFRSGWRDSAESPPLVLRVMTFDTVWLRIVIDDNPPKEYTAPPRWSGQWKAGDHFAISVGNVSAVSFTLNNMFLTLPVKHGKPLLNYHVERPRPVPAEELQ